MRFMVWSLTAVTIMQDRTKSGIDEGFPVAPNQGGRSVFGDLKREKFKVGPKALEVVGKEYSGRTRSIPGLLYSIVASSNNQNDICQWSLNNSL